MRDYSKSARARADIFSLDYLALVALFACEALVFYSQLADQTVAFYPANFDQTAYMLRTYELIQAFHKQGWIAFALEILHPTSATGVTFAVQGALLSILGGPNRTAMLSLNLIYFIGLQVMVYCTVRSLTRNIGLAWVALALVLSLGTTFNFAGGLYDYRMDFSVLCMYGILTCLILTSGGFRRLEPALLIGAVGALLVLSRFFTLAYVGLVVAVLFIASLLGTWWGTSISRRRIAWNRTRNLFACGSLILLITLPILLSAGTLIYNYYGIGHFIGDEKYIRAAESGVYNLTDHLLYYPKSILSVHLGRLTLWLTGAVVLLLLAEAVWRRQVRGSQIFLRLRRFRFEFTALALTAITPIVILTLDISISPVVGGIVVVPIVLLVVLICSAMWPSRFQLRWSLLVVPTILFIVAFSGFLTKATADQRGLLRFDLERINFANDTIARYARESGMRELKFSIDRVVDYLNVSVIKLYAYEHFRQWLPISPGFGEGAYGISATPRAVALKLITESDIVVLTDPVREREHPYPMNAATREYWDELWAWVSQNCTLILSTDIRSVPYRVFAKPLVKVSGQIGDWIMSAGVSIEVDASHLVRWPFIVLEGDANYEWLHGEPRPFAVLVDSSGRRLQDLPATLKAAGNRYQLVIDAREVASPTSEPRTIHLSFDRYFVPREARN